MTDQTFTDIAGNEVFPGDRVVVTRMCTGNLKQTMGKYVGRTSKGNVRVQLEEKVGGLLMADGSPLPTDYFKPWWDFPMPPSPWTSTGDRAAAQAAWNAALVKKQELHEELKAQTIPNPALKYRMSTLQNNLIVKVPQ